MDRKALRFPEAARRPFLQYDEASPDRQIRQRRAQASNGPRNPRTPSTDKQVGRHLNQQHPLDP